MLMCVEARGRAGKGAAAPRPTDTEPPCASGSPPVEPPKDAAERRGGSHRNSPHR